MRTITTALLQNTGTIIRAQFNDAYNDIEKKIPVYWPDVAELVPSNDLKEVYGRFVGLPAYRKWIGPRVINRMTAGDYTIPNEKLELTVAVKGDDLRFDKMGLRNTMAAQQGTRARQLPDQLLWPVVNAGFTQDGLDGQPFFDTDHPILSADGVSYVTASNYIAGAGPAWFLTAAMPGMKPFILQEVYKPDLVEKFDPTDDAVFFNDEFIWGSWAMYGAGYFIWPLIQASKAELTPENFNAAYDAFAARILDGGVKQSLLPTDLWVPTSLRSAANEVAVAKNLANGATNTNAGLVNVRVVPYLADA